MELLTYPAEDVLPKASEALNALFEREFGGPLLVLLSGGSSLALLDGIHSEFLGPHMMITMSDDRYSYDPGVNNFAQMMHKPFYVLAKDHGASFIDTQCRPAETLTGYGARIDAALKDWRAKNPAGRVVMTQGVGPDGHTCGMMPFPHEEKKFKELFEEKEKWAVGYDAAGKNEFPLRATVTAAFLEAQVDESIVYAVGKAKQGALRRVMAKDGLYAVTPAYVLRFMRKAAIFTDQSV